jgi:hypothetical protein
MLTSSRLRDSRGSWKSGWRFRWRWLQTLHPEDREPTRQFWLESGLPFRRA